MPIEYAEIQKQNLAKLVEQSGPVDDDLMTILAHCHAISMQRIANCPGWMDGEISRDRCRALCLDDVKRYLMENKIVGRLKRYATRLAVEAVIVILTEWLEYDRRRNTEETNGLYGSSEFQQDIEGWSEESVKFLASSSLP